MDRYSMEDQDTNNQLASSLAQQLTSDMKEQYSSGGENYVDTRDDERSNFIEEPSLQSYYSDEPSEIPERSSNGHGQLSIVTTATRDTMTTDHRTVAEESTFSSHENYLQIDQTQSAETKSTSTGESKAGTWAGMLSIFARPSSKKADDCYGDDSISANTSMSFSANASASTMSRQSAAPSLNAYAFT